MQIVDHSKNIIEVNDISFSYDGVNILQSISLQVHKGDYVGIVGPNGAGKTTLLKIILGLLNPDKGEVKLFGSNVSSFKDRKKIGYVPQKAINFDPGFPATVREAVLMGRFGKRGILHQINDEDQKKADEAIEHVGLTEMKNKLVGELSGGQQQRVFIARALAGEPEVIFLDEPTTGLDTKTQEEVYTLLKKLNTELEITLVIISHDVSKLVQEAMHIACIDTTLTCYSSPEEFRKNNPGEFSDYHH